MCVSTVGSASHGRPSTGINWCAHFTPLPLMCVTTQGKQGEFPKCSRDMRLEGKFRGRHLANSYSTTWDGHIHLGVPKFNSHLGFSIVQQLMAQYWASYHQQRRHVLTSRPLVSLDPATAVVEIWGVNQ